MGKHVIVTDAGEQPDDWLRVTSETGDQILVEADDPEGVAIAVDTLKGE
jgi:hypothetical protein